MVVIFGQIMQNKFTLGSKLVFQHGKQFLPQAPVIIDLVHGILLFFRIGVKIPFHTCIVVFYLPGQSVHFAGNVFKKFYGTAILLIGHGRMTSFEHLDKSGGTINITFILV